MKYDLKYVIFIQKNKKYGKLDFFLNLDMIIPGGGVNISLPYSILVLYGIDIIIIFLLSHFSG